MTDTIEAAQIADMICGCANREQHRRDVKLIEDYVAARITAHTKALIEGAGEVARALTISTAQRTLGGEQCFASVPLLSQAATTIAALRAEVVRAKLDGVRAGIEAAKEEWTDSWTIFECRIRALSDLIAGDADLIVPPARCVEDWTRNFTRGDSDGDDGA